MDKKQVIYLSITTMLFSLIFPILAIAPVVYFMLSKNSLVNWLLFLSVFCLSLFLINILGWFNSTASFSFVILNYLYKLLLYLFFPFLFAVVFYLFVFVYKKYNSSIMVFILVTAVPFAILFIISLIILNKTGLSYLSFLSSLEELFAKSSIDYSVEKYIQNLIKYEIPRIISLLAICSSLLIEQHLASYLNRREDLKDILKPIKTTKLSKSFSILTIVVIYTLIILKFILKINNFNVEVFLYNLFYFLTTIHFINGIGVLSFFYDSKLKPILINQVLLQLRQRPVLFFIVILGLFALILIFLSFSIYIYFVIAFVSAVDTIYTLRKENINIT